jgi:uncharacterized protein
MAPEVKNNIDKITDACKKHHVKSLYLFGSAARVNDFTENSDIDFLVNFEPVHGNSDTDIFLMANNYQSLVQKLQSITNRKIDLLQEKNIRNKYLKYFINKEKQLVYGVS